MGAYVADWEGPSPRDDPPGIRGWIIFINCLKR